MHYLAIYNTLLWTILLSYNIGLLIVVKRERKRVFRWLVIATCIFTIWISILVHDYFVFG